MDSTTRRIGFTSIELLVVIAIIAILGGLILAGVMSVFGKQSLTRTSADIVELALALERFKTDHGHYPPSQLVFTGAAAPDSASKAILSKIWPSIDYATAFGGAGMTVNAATTLNGDQCLVLFLGGRHSSAGCEGLSTNPRNPFESGGDRKPTYFVFRTERLFQRTGGTQFYSYGDGWHQPGGNTNRPYVYFCLDKVANPDLHAFAADGASTLYPFKDADGAAFINRGSFQILSAGKDRLFGNTRNWPFTSLASVHANSMDNLANFSNGVMSGQ